MRAVIFLRDSHRNGTTPQRAAPKLQKSNTQLQQSNNAIRLRAMVSNAQQNAGAIHQHTPATQHLPTPERVAPRLQAPNSADRFRAKVFKAKQRAGATHQHPLVARHRPALQLQRSQQQMMQVVPPPAPEPTNFTDFPVELLVHCSSLDKQSISRLSATCKYIKDAVEHMKNFLPTEPLIPEVVNHVKRMQSDAVIPPYFYKTRKIVLDSNIAFNVIKCGDYFVTSRWKEFSNDVIQIWDQKGKQTKTLQLQLNFFDQVNLIPLNQSTFVSFIQDHMGVKIGTFQIWNTNGTKITCSPPELSRVTHLIALSGNQFVTASFDGSLCIWNEKGNIEHTFDPNEPHSPIMGLAKIDDTRFASALKNGQVYLYDTKNKSYKLFPECVRGHIWDIENLGDEQFAVKHRDSNTSSSGYEEANFTVYDCKSTTTIGTLEGFSIMKCPGGEFLAGNVDGVQLWSIDPVRSRQRLNTVLQGKFFRTTKHLTYERIDPGNLHNYQGTFCHLCEHQEVAYLRNLGLIKNPRKLPMRELTVLQDGFFTTSSGNSVHIWDQHTLTPIVELREPRSNNIEFLLRIKQFPNGQIGTVFTQNRIEIFG